MTLNVTESLIDQKLKEAAAEQMKYRKRMQEAAEIRDGDTWKIVARDAIKEVGRLSEAIRELAEAIKKAQ
jgi:hypothetical protein